MFHRKFDQLPQENFARVFGESISLDEFPKKNTAIALRTLCFVMGVMAIVTEFRIDFFAHTPIDRWMTLAVAACFGLLTLFWLVFRVFRLSGRAPGLDVFYNLFCSGCNRVCFLWLAVVFTRDYVGDRNGLVSAICAGAFVLAELTANILMFTRVPKRIAAGEYRAAGRGFWDSAKQEKIILLSMIVPVNIAVCVALKVIAYALRTFRIADPDFSQPVKWLVLVSIWSLFAALMLYDAYRNVRENVTLYCVRRFEDDTEGYNFDVEEYDIPEERDSGNCRLQYVYDLKFEDYGMTAEDYLLIE